MKNDTWMRMGHLPQNADCLILLRQKFWNVTDICLKPICGKDIAVSFEFLQSNTTSLCRTLEEADKHNPEPPIAFVLLVLESALLIWIWHRASVAWRSWRSKRSRSLVRESACAYKKFEILDSTHVFQHGWPSVVEEHSNKVWKTRH